MSIFIILVIVAVGAYFLYTNFMGKKRIESSVDPIFSLKSGSVLDFHDLFLMSNNPLKELNILDKGPFTVTQVNRTSETLEYSLKGSAISANLEVENRRGRTILLIQTDLAQFPSLVFDLRNTWKEDIEKFTFKGITYYLTEDGEEVDGNEECYFWDYYSDPTTEGIKLYLGIQDYGDDGYPELEFYAGYEIPERAVKDIIV